MRCVVNVDEESMPLPADANSVHTSSNDTLAMNNVKMSKQAAGGASAKLAEIGSNGAENGLSNPLLGSQGSTPAPRYEDLSPMNEKSAMNRDSKHGYAAINQ